MRFKHWAKVLAGICTSATILAQPPDSLWSEPYGTAGVENSFSFVQASDGGFALAGWELPFGGAQYDFWLLRTNADGDSLWSRSYGTPLGNEYAFTVCSTSDGGYLVGGYTDVLTIGPTDAWVVKTDASGNQQWNRRYGGLGYDWCLSAQEISGGGFILGGWTDPLLSGVGDGWLAKTNSTGDTAWTRRIGGALEDRFYAVRQNGDGSFVAAGRTLSDGAGASDAWLVKVNSAGTVLWNRAYGGTGNDRFYSLSLTSDGGYICSGSTESYGALGENGWIVRLNANGDTLWTRTLGGTMIDRAWAVEETNDGGFMLSGQSASSGSGGDDFWIAHLDASGVVEWSRTFGGAASDICYDAMQTDDGGYALAGQTASFGAGTNDMWLVRLSSSGDLIPPQGVVMKVTGGSLRLYWRHDANPYYRIYRDTAADGSFATFIGSTTDTTYFVLNGASLSRQFYRVIGSTTP